MKVLFYFRGNQKQTGQTGGAGGGGGWGSCLPTTKIERERESGQDFGPGLSFESLCLEYFLWGLLNKAVYVSSGS